MITITDTLGTAGTITADKYDVADWLRENFAGDAETVAIIAEYATAIENGNINDIAGELADFAGVEIA